MGHEIQGSLCFWEFEDLAPEAITALLGVEPSRVMRTGDSWGRSGTRVWPYNGWIWEASADKSTPFDVQCSALLDLLEARREAIKSFSHRCSGEIACMLWLYADNGESTPSVHLDARYHALASEGLTDGAHADDGNIHSVEEVKS